jgi:hypothetical protein
VRLRHKTIKYYPEGRRMTGKVKWDCGAMLIAYLKSKVVNLK